MRDFALLLISLLVIACGADGERPIFFPNGLQVSRARCAEIPQLNARGSIVNDVVATANSRIVVLYGAERQLVTYDPNFRPLSIVSFERDGPRGVRGAVSATTDGELYYVADEKQMLIKLLDSDGHDRGTVRLDFVPRRLRTAGGSIVISPLVMGGHPTSLLHVLRNERSRSLPVPRARYEDVGINAFANMSSVAAFPNGRVIIMHEMIVPFGYSMSLANSASSIKRFAVPLPESQRSKFGRLPVPPLTDKNVNELLAVALTATPDPVTGHTYYLTRSGRRIGGFSEKMVVELDTALNFVRAATVLNRRPLHMVYVPSRAALLIVDDSHQWFECKM